MRTDHPRDERIVAVEHRAARAAYYTTALLTTAATFVFMFILDDMRAGVVMLGLVVVGGLVYLGVAARNGLFRAQREEIVRTGRNRRRAIIGFVLGTVALAGVYFLFTYYLIDTSVESALWQTLFTTVAWAVLQYWFTIRRPSRRESEEAAQ